MKYANIHDEVAHKNIRAYIISTNKGLTDLKALRQQKVKDALLYGRAYNTMYNNLHSYFSYLGNAQTGIPRVTQNEWHHTYHTMFSTTTKMLSIWHKVVEPYYVKSGEAVKIMSLTRTIKKFCDNTATNGENTDFTKAVSEWADTHLTSSIYYCWDKSSQNFNIVLSRHWTDGFKEINLRGSLFRPQFCYFNHNGTKYRFFDGQFNATVGKGQLTNSTIKAQGVFVLNGIFEKLDFADDHSEAFKSFIKQYYNRDVFI